jgi:hypothetical protein
VIVWLVEADDRLPRPLMDLLTQAFDGFYNSPFFNRVYDAFFDKVIDRVIGWYFEPVLDWFLEMMTHLLDHVDAGAGVVAMLALAE